MSLAIVYSRAAVGVEAPLVRVEVHVASGMPGFTIVGLPEASVRESKDRVRSALVNSHFEFPSKRITVNLAPADLPKEGGRFDLAIAIGILAASEQVQNNRLEDVEFYGELALSGEINGVKAVISSVVAAAEASRNAVLPVANAGEAELVDKGHVLLASNIMAVFEYLQGQRILLGKKPGLCKTANPDYPDMQDVIGQPLAKRALEIAAAGGHNLLFMGPPGTGKTMLASRLPGILPEMTHAEAVETAVVYSVAGKGRTDGEWKQRPFRSPHHTCSAVALIGGSSNPKPGEVSLAHNGVLFLDELPEFERKVLDVLREPLESHTVIISRAARQAQFPARFQLVAAMNPTPCGHYNEQQARSSPEQVRKYLSRLSGPFLDRIDIQIEVPRLPQGSLSAENQQSESSQTVKKRVINARDMQLQRSGKPNAQLSNQELSKVARLNRQDAERLEAFINKLGLSARVYHRVLKVARTIADLQLSKQVTDKHIGEALNYRALERFIRQLNQ